MASKKPALTVGCVYVMVNDMTRAVKFYTRVLGLPLVVRYADNWAEVDAGSTRIGLHPVDDGKAVTPGGGGTLSFFVKELDALAVALRKKGARVGDVRPTPRGKMTMMQDSEGNLLHLTEFSPEWIRRAKYPLPRARRG